MSIKGMERIPSMVKFTEKNSLKNTASSHHLHTATDSTDLH
jgi:hypothetical protein